MIDNGSFGIYLRVKNLDACRSFYRDLLEMGEPVVDSTFWVEFQPKGAVRFVLEKSAALYLEHAASSTSFVCYTESVERVLQRLNEHGFNPQPVEMARPGAVYHRCLDPEGNLFYLAAIER